MIREVFYHNTGTYEAVIRFEHNGVYYLDTFNLSLVIPDAMPVLNQLNLEFTPEMQDQVIEKLTERVRLSIESGGIKNPPVVEELLPAPEAPPPPVREDPAAVAPTMREDDDTANRNYQP
jgi:hypothetical protein